MKNIDSLIENLYGELEKLSANNYISDYIVETEASEMIGKLLDQGKLSEDIAYEYTSELIKGAESMLEDNGYELAWQTDRLGNKVGFIYYKDKKGLEKWVRNLDIFIKGKFKSYEDKERQINKMITNFN